MQTALAMVTTLGNKSIRIKIIHKSGTIKKI